jgi:hypothetical protein
VVARIPNAAGSPDLREHAITTAVLSITGRRMAIVCKRRTVDRIAALAVAVVAGRAVLARVVTVEALVARDE